MSEEKAQVCTGACLFGKCPFDTCIKYQQKKRRAAQLNVEMQILTDGDIRQIQGDKSGYGMAVDIGTTTVVAYLIKLDDCKRIGTASRLNAQATLGVDVISRIKYCTDVEGGLQLLNEAVVREINLMTAELAVEAGIAPGDIRHIVVTGNTTMLHLFAGLSPVTMGYSPFTPASTFGVFEKGAALGLDATEADVYLVDCISSFVGGDIVSAILDSGMYYGDDLCLLLDLGTNGEVALGSRHGILATSTAAGPAFEGAQLSHGMASVKGAINSAEVLEGELCLTTIGNAPIAGICGSGIVDAMAFLLDAGLVDETGRIADADEVPEKLRDYLTEENGAPAVKIADGIVITQKDIREIQTAKAAVAAGVLSLLHHAGKNFSDVKKVFLAGGFGNYMNAQSAVRIGLLPKETQDRIYPIGNAAGAGAVMALCSDRYRLDGKAIRDAGEHVELGHNPYFMDKYVECMMFE